MRFGDKIIHNLGRCLRDWDFLVVDSVGNFRVLVEGWGKSISLLNTASFGSEIWTNFMIKELGQTIYIINVWTIL
jgi:hypothetical protein